jgi:hypothetical protein
MKTLTIILALAITTAAQAQVLIYKSKGTGTKLGNGQSTKETVTGYAIFDANQGESVWVTGYASRRYEILIPDEFMLIEAVGSGGKRTFVYQEAYSGFDDLDRQYISSLYAKGAAALTDIGLMGKMLVPKTMTLSERSVYYSGNGTPMSLDATGTLTLDLKLTKDANFFGYDLNEAIAAVEQLMLSQGYQPLGVPRSSKSGGRLTPPVSLLE